MKRAILLIAITLAFSFANAKFEVIEEKGNTIVVQYTIDDYRIIQSDGFSHIRTMDALYPDQPGKPSVPTLEFKVGIPQNGSAVYKVLSEKHETIELPTLVAPVPFVLDNEGLSEYQYVPDKEMYQATAEGLLTAMESQIFRSVVYIPFTIRPFSYNGDKTLRITTAALIKITLNGDLAKSSEMLRDEMDERFLTHVLNPESTRKWSIADPQQQQLLKSGDKPENGRSLQLVNFADFSKSPWWIKIETDKPGMYRINPSQLTGFPLSDIDPKSFRLFTSTGKILPFTILNPGNAFREVPIRVVGEEDQSFDANDYIIFYGSNRTGFDTNDLAQATPLYHNPYSNNTVYWLTFAGDFSSPPLRIQNASTLDSWSSEHTSHREVVHVETETHRREIEGLTWYMTRMFGSGVQDFAYDVSLPDLDPAEPQTLQLNMIQEKVSSSLQHKLSVHINDPQMSSTGQAVWYGTNVLNYTMSTSSFVSGSNRFVIRLLRDRTINYYFDYYRVTYGKKLIKSNAQYNVNQTASIASSGAKYNFTGSATGVETYQVVSHDMIRRIPVSAVSGGFSFAAAGNVDCTYYVTKPEELYSPVSIQYKEPNILTDTASSYDNIIVCASEFLPQANELALAYQQNWGLRSKVVSQNDVFDQFNGGHPDPLAIRQFLRYAYYNYQSPKIKTLTLLGQGTIDWRNYSGIAAPMNKIMVYQHPSSQIASDDYLGMINTSNFPEIAIGRYPVKTSNEMNTMLSNFLRYTQSPKPGLWRNSMVFLADDLNNGTTTNEWVHTEDLEEAATVLNPSLMIDKIFAVEYDYDEFQNKPRVRDEMFNKINDGKLIWYYVGHGSFDVLGSENYFTGATDMGRFNNPDMLPLFIASSCKVSHFDYWGYESLGQKSVLLNNKGAIASIGASRISYPDPNHQLMMLLLKNATNSYLTVGSALIDAKMRYTQMNSNDETYILLGDPNLYIVPPLRDQTITVKANSRIPTLRSRQAAEVEGFYSTSHLDGTASMIAFSSDALYNLGGRTLSQKGSQMYRGNISVNNSAFQGGFIVPDDISSGNNGLVISYFWDDRNKKDHISYYHPLSLSDDAVLAENSSSPKIDIYLGSYDFRPGDTVHTTTTIFAKISDSNGINLTGAAGHNILLVIDNSLQPIPVTDYFSYDLDSYTSGTLVYPLTNLSEGLHNIQIIAFDNFNLPAVANTHFIAKYSPVLSIENFLIYPNPIKDNGYISFIISEPADITLDVFTMSGRRIRRMESAVNIGFNKILFNGCDDFGDRLANNTYFVRLRAKNRDGKTTEKTERLVMYK